MVPVNDLSFSFRCGSECLNLPFKDSVQQNKACSVEGCLMVMAHKRTEDLLRLTEKLVSDAAGNGDIKVDCKLEPRLPLSQM